MLCHHFFAGIWTPPSVIMRNFLLRKQCTLSVFHKAVLISHQCCTIQVYRLKLLFFFVMASFLYGDKPSPQNLCCNKLLMSKRLIKMLKQLIPTAHTLTHTHSHMLPKLITEGETFRHIRHVRQQPFRQPGFNMTDPESLLHF